MANVDPFVISWPKAWTEDREIGPVVHYLNRFLHDLWLRSGGGSDFMSDASTQELYPWKTGEVQEQNLAALYSSKGASKEFEVVEVTGTTHTTAGNEIVICTNTSPLVVTLNANPDHMERAIIVRNSTGAVSVTSTKQISGKTTKKILRRYSAPDHIFTTEANTWSVI